LIGGVAIIIIIIIIIMKKYITYEMKDGNVTWGLSHFAMELNPHVARRHDKFVFSSLSTLLCL